MTPAILVLEDGRTFLGESFGAEGETFGQASVASRQVRLGDHGSPHRGDGDPELTAG